MTSTNRRARYSTMKVLLENALNDLEILAGNRMGPSDASWQDVAGTAALNLQALAGQLTEARTGNCESCIVFPSPGEYFYETENFYRGEQDA